MKRNVIIFLLLIASVSLVFAGGQGEDEGGKDEVVTLRLADWNAEDRPWETEIYNEFARLNGCKIENIHIPDGYDQKLITMTAGGNPPDMMLYWDTPRYVEAGLVQDISDLLKRDNFNPPSKYSIVNNFENYKGSTYGISQELTPRVIYYNKALFDEAGVPYPRDGWTWDEFIATVDKLTYGEGDDAHFGYVALAGDTYLLQQYIWSAGGDLVSDDGMNAIGYMDSAKTIKAIEFYKKVFDRSVVNIQNRSSYVGGEQEFLSGRVAMLDQGSWPCTSFKEIEGLDFGTVSPPVPADGVPFKPIIHSSAWGISVKSENRDLAWELLKFMNSEYAQKLYAAHAIPARKDIAEAVGYYEDEHFKTFVQLAELDSKAPCFMRNPRWWEADGEFASAMEEILLNDAPIEATLNKAAAKADAILKGEM